MNKAHKFPLVDEGYDILECPQCDRICYPSGKLHNGSIVYEPHNCKPTYSIHTTPNYMFAIDKNGDLVE